MMPLPSSPPSGKRPGKQIRGELGLRGSKLVRAAETICGEGRRSLEAVEFRRLRGHTHAGSSRRPPTTCVLLLPPCFPGFPDRGGEAKNGPEGPF